MTSAPPGDSITCVGVVPDASASDELEEDDDDEEDDEEDDDEDDAR